jgi:transcription antitermination factor NusG
MAVNWYALRTKSRKENAVWQQLKNKAVEVYYPRMRVNPVNPRSSKHRPYFPGYMFVQVDLDTVSLTTFQWMPHTLGLVSFGGDPAPVPDALIHAIHKRVEEINSAGGEELDGLKAGDPVWIQDGPFKGYEALFDSRLPGNERVRVLLKFLSNRQVPMELHASQIKKVRRRRRRS